MSSDETSCKRLIVRVSADRLSCTVTILPGSIQDTPTELGIAAVLEDHHLAASAIDRDAVEGLLTRARSDPNGEHTSVVARGTPAEDGTHADFTLDPELAAAFEAIERRRDHLRAHGGAPQPETETTINDHPGGAIDYHEQSAFVIVHRGDTIGTITEATQGVDGIDIRGEVIPAKGGHSLTVSLDESTLVRDGKLVAAVNGRLVTSIDSVRVERTLAVKGDVDYETGNIDFPGEVEIRGGVKDNFRVRTAGDLRVEGLIEAAQIRAGRDARLDRGMAGRGSGAITTARDLHAHYLDGVEASVGRDCYAGNEIKESTIRVSGAVHAAACAVYASTVTTLKPAEFAIVGSPSGVGTAVEIGVLPELDSLIDKLGSVLDSLDAEKQRSADELRALNETIRKLTPTQAERLTELQYTQIHSDELAEKIAVAAGQLLDAVRELPVPKLTVHRVLHKGVRVRLRHCELVIKDAIRTPLVLDLDPAGAPRCCMNGSHEPTPINTIARRVDEGRPNPLTVLTEYANRVGGGLRDAA